MKRREFLQRSSLTAILAGTGGAASALAAELPVSGAFAFASPPVLQNPAPDDITVVWAVNGLATGWVEYGETEALGQRSDGGVQGLMPLDDRVMKIRLTGLRPGRKYWHDLPVQAKVQLVISGHTHETAWFPAGTEAPYAQLVGGGPKPEAATLIQGHADRRELRLAMQNLAGKELGTYTVKA